MTLREVLLFHGKEEIQQTARPAKHRGGLLQWLPGASRQLIQRSGGQSTFILVNAMHTLSAMHVQRPLSTWLAMEGCSVHCKMSSVPPCWRSQRHSVAPPMAGGAVRPSTAVSGQQSPGLSRGASQQHQRPLACRDIKGSDYKSRSIPFIVTLDEVIKCA